ncbi:MAG TPA: hypothetical protein VED46_11980 [Alphaproteobacteria bacterium]|nr:hypothetical protein [Alphaproteobacteria bacterium]
MTRIETATDRLNKAIGRLERAVAARGGRKGEAEQPRLDFARASIEADQAALRKMADALSGRLDSAIGRLKLMLEG